MDNKPKKILDVGVGCPLCDSGQVMLMVDDERAWLVTAFRWEEIPERPRDYRWIYTLRGWSDNLPDLTHCRFGCLRCGETWPLPFANAPELQRTDVVFKLEVVNG